MAERSERRRTIQGGLIILGLAVAVVLIFMLDPILGAFTRKYDVVAVFPEAADLVVDAPVWLSGKPVGTVRSVELEPVTTDTLGQVIVVMRLPRRVREHVRQDSRARLTSATLIGERVVDISAGSAAFPVLREGDTIRARLPRAFAELTAQLDSVQAAVDSMLGAVGAVRDRLPERVAALRPAGRQLAEAQSELDALLDDIARGPGAAALRDPELRAALGRIGTNFEALQRLAGDAGDAAAGTGDELRIGIGRMLARADTLSARLAALDQRLNDPDGFAGRFARDSALIHAVAASRAELDSLVADARRNPFRFFRLRL
jgi:ABC-type transporter Mla subunit MlaD